MALSESPTPFLIPFPAFSTKIELIGFQATSVVFPTSPKVFKVLDALDIPRAVSPNVSVDFTNFVPFDNTSLTLSAAFTAFPAVLVTLTGAAIRSNGSANISNPNPKTSDNLIFFLPSLVNRLALPLPSIPKSLKILPPDVSFLPVSPSKAPLPTSLCLIRLSTAPNKAC